MRPRRAGESLYDVWEGIRAQPGRVGLTFLAIAVGITALTLLMAVLGGLRERSERILRELGANAFAILPGHTADGREIRGGLTRSHVSYLATNMPDAVVSAVKTYDVPTPGSDRDVKVVATDPNLPRVRQWRLADGRFLEWADMAQRARYAVLTTALSREWRRRVGDTIVLRTTPYEIVGIVETPGGALDETGAGSELAFGDQVVFTPIDTPAHWEAFWHASPYVDAIFVRGEGPADVADLVRRSRRLLEQPDQHVSGVSWLTPDSLLRGVRRLQNTIKVTVGSIALLCLILGGTTLMSLMVANVRDRVTEIGLRRALGAYAADIGSLFVLEACLVTATGALVGTGGTHLLLFLARPYLPVPVRFGLDTALLPVAAAVVLGVLFAYAPARAAARIAPSEALRNE